MALTSPPSGPATASERRSRDTAFASRALDRLFDPRMMPVVAAGLLVVLTLLVFVRQLFLHWTFQWDFLGAYSTSPAFVAATIGSGHPLSWSPFVASGFPVDVDPQAGVYFPIWWIFGALGVPLNLTAATVVQVVHVCFGAAGVLALARVRRLGWPWATAAAVAYLFFGGFYGQAEHADIFRGFAYLPWLLWALTPPPPGRRWVRLGAVPLLAWLVASGAYPGQLASFAIVGVVYVAVSWGVAPVALRRHLGALALAAVASVAVAAAVLLPYLIATRHNELIRLYQPTAAVRADQSFAPIDILGLELNPFAWHFDGSIYSWALAVPILIGIACSTRATVRRHIPLLAGGVVALLLATAARIGPIGKAMVALGPVFPSRFPASDYKPAVAIALIVLSAEAWASLSDRKVRIWPAAVVGGALAAGAIFAPSTHSPPTRTLWLVLLVIAATFALIAFRPRPHLLVAALIALIAIDGVRDARDIRARGGISSWQMTPTEAAPFRANERHVPNLRAVLLRAPVTRPPRIPPVAPLSLSPRGNPPDAAGWVANGYHLNDYTGPLELVLWHAEQSPTWMRLMLQPWHAFVFPCAASGCPSSARSLPPPTAWHPSPDVRTLSYGAGRIVYQAQLTRPAVMVENELAIRGWHVNTPRARIVKSGIPLRMWQLSPGTYRFIASYHESGRTLQYALVGVALLGWLGTVLLLAGTRRGPLAGDRLKDPPASALRPSSTSR